MNAGKDKAKRGLTWCLVAMSTFALLIWAKLRLVTGVPRTAYAVPEESPRPAVDKQATLTTPSASPSPAAKQ